MEYQEPGAARITVAEAFRRVREAIEKNDAYRRFPDIVTMYSSVQMHEVGKEPVPPTPPTRASYGAESGKEIAIKGMKESFLAFCRIAGLTPRSLHNPWANAPYTGDGYEDFTHDIALNEYERWSEPYLQPTIPWRSKAGGNEVEPSANSVVSAVNSASASLTTEVDGEREQAISELSELFDSVTVESLEKMFPASGKWKHWADRAGRNGLIKAREGRALFNPYRAALWFLRKGLPGWDLGRCHRKLAENLPARSRHEGSMLTGDLN